MANEEILRLPFILFGPFLVDFLVHLLRSPSKLTYLKTNWLTAISLLLPALRVFRIFRLFRLLRFSRATRLVKLLGSVNRGMRSLGRTLGQRGLPYVLLLTVMVTFLGAAAFYAFEQDSGGPIRNYNDAVWFTGMIMTTMGSDYWPKSQEGRILCFALSLYAFAVFGYFTAALASFFIGGDQRDHEDVQEQLNGIKSELRKINDRLSILDK